MRVTGILIYIQDLVYNNICKYEREFFDNIVSLLQSYHHPLVKGVSVCPASVNDRKHVAKKNVTNSALSRAEPRSFPASRRLGPKKKKNPPSLVM